MDTYRKVWKTTYAEPQVRRGRVICYHDTPLKTIFYLYFTQFYFLFLFLYHFKKKDSLTLLLIQDYITASFNLTLPASPYFILLESLG